ncbi:MAG: hypothetical protein SFY80_07875 [Verrucomicrobiota bacterium]|nr:hypothetical protein [Verrucomicrobiota bacterium]
MKIIRSTAPIRIPPIRLYLDDLDNLIRQLPDDSELSVMYDNTEYESLEELLEHVSRDHISSLNLIFRYKNSFDEIRIDIEPRGVTISRPYQNEKDAPFVKDLLSSHVKWYSWHPTGYWWNGILGMICGMSIFLIVYLTPFLPLNNFIKYPAGLLLSLVIFYILFLGHSFIGSSKIFLNRKHKYKSFWYRNKDNIILVIITAIISYFLGLISRF